MKKKKIFKKHFLKPTSAINIAICFSEVRGAKSLVFCVVFCISLFALFGNCMACPSLIYDF